MRIRQSQRAYVYARRGNVNARAEELSTRRLIAVLAVLLVATTFTVATPSASNAASSRGWSGLIRAETDYHFVSEDGLHTLDESGGLRLDFSGDDGDIIATGTWRSVDHIEGTAPFFCDRTTTVVGVLEPTVYPFDITTGWPARGEAATYNVAPGGIMGEVTHTVVNSCTGSDEFTTGHPYGLMHTSTGEPPTAPAGWTSLTGSQTGTGCSDADCTSTLTWDLTPSLCTKTMRVFASVNAEFPELRGETPCWTLVRFNGASPYANFGPIIPGTDPVEQEANQNCQKSNGFRYWAYNEAHGSEATSEDFPHSPELDRDNIRKCFNKALRRNPASQGLVFVAHTLWNEEPALVESHIPRKVPLLRVMIELFDSNTNFPINWPNGRDEARYAGMVHITVGSHASTRADVLELCQKSSDVMGVFVGTGGIRDQARADAVFAALDECTTT